MKFDQIFLLIASLSSLILGVFSQASIEVYPTCWQQSLKHHHNTDNISIKIVIGNYSSFIQISTFDTL